MTEDHPLFRLPHGELPPGELILSEDDQPALWLSDEPVEPGLWARLRAGHERSGFWPLLLRPDDDGGPWNEIDFDGLTAPADHDPEAVLRTWWETYAGDEDENFIAPFGETWPDTPAPTPPHRLDADKHADAVANSVLADLPGMRLGLVAAGSGAEALTAAGWQGPLNHTNDTAKFSAVVGDWERRYGARVIAIDGWATLYLSITAPPTDRDQARRTSAEHFAFCPDNFWQGAANATIRNYAHQLVGSEMWTFWWD